MKIYLLIIIMLTNSTSLSKYNFFHIIHYVYAHKFILFHIYILVSIEIINTTSHICNEIIPVGAIYSKIDGVEIHYSAKISTK